jgi:hypothetical protein
MRAPAWYEDAGDRLRRLGLFPLLARLVIIAAAVVCVFFAAALGDTSFLLSVLVLVTAIVAASSPDSGAPLVLILVMSGTWFAAVRPVSIPWSIVLAICVLAVHLGAARSATLVPGTAFDRGSVRLWLGQAGVVLAGTAAVWAFCVRLAESPSGGNLIVSAVALTAVAALGVGLALGTGSSADD